MMNSGFIAKLAKVPSFSTKDPSKIFAADSPRTRKTRHDSFDQPMRSQSTRTDSVQPLRPASTSVTTFATVPAMPTKYHGNTNNSIFKPTKPDRDKEKDKDKDKEKEKEKEKEKVQRRKSVATTRSRHSTIVESKASHNTSALSKVNSGWRIEGNRRFQEIPGSSYPLPADDQEIDRIQTQHYLLRFAFTHNMVAPVQSKLRDGATVLDIGCASGTWQLELATEYPNSLFHGLDMHPCFPDLVKPPNTHFQVCNVLEGLPFRDRYFDFVHMRFMACAFTELQWTKIIREIIRVAKPGGWVELFESEMTPKRVGPQSALVFKQINFALQARGIDVQSPFRLGVMLEDACLVDVKGDYSSIPIGWGGRPGDCQKENFMALMRSMKPWLARSLAFKEEKYDSLTPIILQECAEYKSFVNYHFAYGMIPLLT